MPENSPERKVPTSLSEALSGPLSRRSRVYLAIARSKDAHAGTRYQGQLEIDSLGLELVDGRYIDPQHDTTEAIDLENLPESDI